jgi:hypothetical protein
VPSLTATRTIAVPGQSKPSNDPRLRASVRRGS